mmetsp:Transcript_47173/g.125325  ORF Transcript_47173/g.125325 Transcript_47173/m.125325 type:complete len:110 (+) Transcript_47173:1460-1789(+)
MLFHEFTEHPLMKNSIWNSTNGFFTGKVGAVSGMERRNEPLVIPGRWTLNNIDQTSALLGVIANRRASEACEDASTSFRHAVTESTELFLEHLIRANEVVNLIHDDELP